MMVVSGTSPNIAIRPNWDQSFLTEAAPPGRRLHHHYHNQHCLVAVSSPSLSASSAAPVSCAAAVTSMSRNVKTSTPPVTKVVVSGNEQCRGNPEQCLHHYYNLQQQQQPPYENMVAISSDDYELLRAPAVLPRIGGASKRNSMPPASGRADTRRRTDGHLVDANRCQRPPTVSIQQPDAAAVAAASAATAVSIRADRSPTSPRPRSIANDAVLHRVPVTDPSVTAATDATVALAFARLEQSGFYFSGVSSTEARCLLSGHPPGTFLVRPSSDPRYLFSLTVRIPRNEPDTNSRVSGGGSVTSVRIVHESGRFRLDGDPERGHLLPAFPCVLELIRHHVRMRGTSGGGGLFVFLERSGCGIETPVMLRRPLLRPEASPSTLAHLCRRRINAALDGRSVDRLHLVPSLKQYLKDYPSDL